MVKDLGDKKNDFFIGNKYKLHVKYNKNVIDIITILEMAV